MNLFKLPSFLILSTIVILFAACEDSGDPASTEPPTISFSDTSFVATFFEAGSFPAPTIDWKGEVGTVTIIPSLPDGFSIDPNSGSVGWSDDLPTGIYGFTIEVSNSNGSAGQFVRIENPPVGTFTGSLQRDNLMEPDFLEFQLAADKTLAVEFTQGSSTYNATGTWDYANSFGNLQANYNEIDMEFRLDLDPFFFDYLFEADVTFTTDSARLGGEYFLGDGVSTKIPDGDFEVAIGN